MTILDKRPHLRAGEKQRFVCVATGSRPEAILSWWVEGEAVRAEGGRVTSAASGERTTSSLYFVPRPQDSGKTLHCRASTPQIHRGVIQDSWKLDIQCELLPNLYRPQNRPAASVRSWRSKKTKISCQSIFPFYWLFPKSTFYTFTFLYILRQEEIILMFVQKMHQSQKGDCYFWTLFTLTWLGKFHIVTPRKPLL